MRIPLDYYRILGLPIQATGEQLKQAHQDRTLQLPRKEYSEVAIEARRQLIDEAYSVLADADQRRDYDSKFLAKTYALETTLEGAAANWSGEPSVEMGEATLRSLAVDTTPAEGYAPTIEIDDQQFVGALLILLELGEYELVIRLGQPLVGSGFQTQKSGQFADVGSTLPDTLLTLTLAYLELGREQWQQRQYEVAAESLETGHRLLSQQNLFPAIRAEIQSELYKLRPYRVLELLARPLDQTRERRRGIKLLKSMLEDRGGIEGTENDLSGLSIDDFLRFIQQLRDYLTAAEQQELFENEARRPSAVAIYLTVYALLARGFARHQPALVRRAKQLLLRIGMQQDVHLEQAVCALLLGQTEEASHALELSQEYEPLAFIREHSQGAPDLLPGLCLYSERWLRDEVFPHFRDFQEQSATLKEYFADPQVQVYLETMPRDGGSEGAVARPMVNSPHFSMPRRMAQGAPAPASMTGVFPSKVVPSNPFDLEVDRGASQSDEKPDTSPSVAERVAQLSKEGQLQPRVPSKASSHGIQQPTSPSQSGADDGLRMTSRPRAVQPRWDRLFLLVLAGFLGIGLLGFLTTRTFSWVANRFSGPKVEGEPLAIRLDAPPIAVPEAPAEPEEIGVEDIAERAIEDWLAAKREALGETHNIDALEATLADPMLNRWQGMAREVEQANSYWEYTHEVEVQSVEPDDPTADQLQATVRVQEEANHFELGVQNMSSSYNADLIMRYSLVRQDGEWRVQDSEKLSN